MTDVVNEDLPYIEPEWKSAAAVIAVVLVGLLVIASGLWLL